MPRRGAYASNPKPPKPRSASEPGYDYHIRHGISPEAIVRDLTSEPLDSGDTAYLLVFTDTDASSGGRFYQLVRTAR